MTINFSLLKTKMLFEQLPSIHKEDLLSIASSGMVKEYLDLPAVQASPLTDLDKMTLILKIHESWLEEVLLLSSQNDQLLYLSTFPKEKAQVLMSRLKLKGSLYHFAPPLANVILSEFLSQFFDFSSAPPPLSLLPDEPLLPLVEGSYTKLLELCFFLGLYDVHYELKKVLKGSVLKQLEECLTDREALFLREIGQERSMIAFADIGLNHWDGDKELLRHVILHRGLNRLGKALAKSGSPLCWYIIHMLDTENGREMKKLLVHLRDEKLLSLLEDQVINGWKKVCTASH